jgi:hypothetical protein
MKATFVILFCLLALLSCGGSDNKNLAQTTKSVNKDSLWSQNNERVNLNFYELSIDSILAKKDLEITDTFFLALVKEDYAFIAKKMDNLEDSTWHEIDVFDNRKKKQDFDLKLHCVMNNEASYPYYKFEDMNGDGIKDILLKFNQDSKGNEQWNLFLVKPEVSGIRLIHKFKYLNNPLLLPNEKIIKVSSSNRDSSFTEFFYIEKDFLKFKEGIKHTSKGEEKYYFKNGF